MKNANETKMTAAQAADIVQTSTDSQAILEAWETAVELFKEGDTGDSGFDEDVTIALTGWTRNKATPEKVITEFWEDQDIRLLADEVWGEVLAEIMALPETPEEIKQEIKETF